MVVNSSSASRVVISCLVILTVACLCLACTGIVGLTVVGETIFNGAPATPRAGLDSNATPIPDEEDAAPTPEGALTPGASTAISAQVAKQMDEIQQQVSTLRGLQSQTQVTRSLLSPEQLRQRVIDDFLNDYTPEEAEQDARVLAALGLLEPGFDLRNFYIDLLSEQVVGFYDNEVKEMVVVQGEAFGGAERLTYAHEFTHVLQDQIYDIDRGLNYNDEACEQDTERCAATQALMEGDATLSELQWLDEFATRQDRLDITLFYASYESPVYDLAPVFMQKDFIFPYEQGLAFVQTLYDRGGWAAVDAAYRSLPASTEQIMHPERYPDDLPATVTLPDLEAALGAGWSELERNVMGEWYTWLILTQGWEPAARISLANADAAAQGWGGDAYVVYYQAETQSLVFAMQTLWESAGDADEFFAAFDDYARGRFGTPTVQNETTLGWEFPGGYSELRRSGDQTCWLLVPDAGLAQTIWEMLPGF